MVTLVLVKFDGVVYPESRWSMATFRITVPGITPILFCSATDIPVVDISDIFEDAGCC